MGTILDWFVTSSLRGLSVVVGGAGPDLLRRVDESTRPTLDQPAVRILPNDRLVYVAPRAGTGSLGPESIIEGLDYLLECNPDDM